MKRFLLFLLLIPVVVSAGLAVYFLFSLDSIVHGTLYDYGLQFSYEWAVPYWNALRMVQLLIGSTVALSVFSFLVVYKMQVQVKPKRPRVIETTIKAEAPVKVEPKAEAKIEPRAEHKVEQTFERKIVSPPPLVRETKPEPPQPEPVSVEEKTGGLFRCNHCNRVFAQPLRMLDFHENQPRIISICPFCNEVIQTAVRKDETDSERKLSFLKRKNNNEKIQVQQ
jgi:hypothetical protein